MPAGQRNRYCSIERRSDLQDAAGEVITGWVEHAKRWTAIVPLSGKEAVDARQLVADVTHELTMLYVNDLTPDMRVRYGERVFQIKSALDIADRHRDHVLLCEETIVS